MAIDAVTRKRLNSATGHGNKNSRTARLRRPARVGAKSHAGTHKNTRRVTRGQHHAKKYKFISAHAHSARTRILRTHRMKRTRIVLHTRVLHHRTWRPRGRYRIHRVK